MGFNYLFIFPPCYFALWDSKAHHRPTGESVSWCLETSLFFKTPFPGRISVPTSFVSLFNFYILSYLLSKTTGCFSVYLMSSASIQKLFCRICSALKCSFDEFVGEKAVSLSYSSAILGPPLCTLIFDKGLESCDYHHNQCTEHFYHVKNSLKSSILLEWTLPNPWILLNSFSPYSSSLSFLDSTWINLCLYHSTKTALINIINHLYVASPRIQFLFLILFNISDHSWPFQLLENIFPLGFLILYSVDFLSNLILDALLISKCLTFLRLAYRLFSIHTHFPKLYTLVISCTILNIFKLLLIQLWSHFWTPCIYSTAIQLSNMYFNLNMSK